MYHQLQTSYAYRRGEHHLNSPSSPCSTGCVFGSHHAANRFTPSPTPREEHNLFESSPFPHDDAHSTIDRRTLAELISKYGGPASSAWIDGDQRYKLWCPSQPIPESSFTPVQGYIRHGQVFLLSFGIFLLITIQIHISLHGAIPSFPHQRPSRKQPGHSSHLPNPNICDLYGPASITTWKRSSPASNWVGSRCPALTRTSSTPPNCLTLHHSSIRARKVRVKSTTLPIIFARQTWVMSLCMRSKGGGRLTIRPLLPRVFRRGSLIAIECRLTQWTLILGLVRSIVGIGLPRWEKRSVCTLSELRILTEKLFRL